MWYVARSMKIWIVFSHAAAQTKPLEGAETGGATGFFKGIGKGLVGYAFHYRLSFLSTLNGPFWSVRVVAKPMVGVRPMNLIVHL